MNGIIDLYNVADFCEAIHKGACGFLGMAAQGNLDAADLIDQFIHLRDEPGSTIHTRSSSTNSAQTSNRGNGA